MSKLLGDAAYNAAKEQTVSKLSSLKEAIISHSKGKAIVPSGTRRKRPKAKAKSK